MKKKKESRLFRIHFSDIMEDNADFIPVVADGDDADINEVEIPDVLSILPLRNTVLFPGVVMPLAVGREKSLKLIREVYSGNRLLGTVAQIKGEVEDPTREDLFSVGTMAEVMRILEMPDGSTSVIIQGRRRFQIKEFLSDDPYFTATVEPLEEVKNFPEGHEFEAIIESLKDLSLQIIKVSGNVHPEAAFALKNIQNPIFLINFICSNTEIEMEEKQKLLEMNDMHERSIQLMSYLIRQLQVLELKKDIQQKVKVDIDQQQKEFFLHQQMKTIQDELGGTSIEKEIDEFRERGKNKKWNKEVAEHFEKELKKLFRLNPAAGEYSVQLGYVQTLLELPWNDYSEDNFDLKHAQDILDADHYGLEKVKDRIIEHLAVLKLKGDLKAPIICLYGPPGVGKTSLGKSIAKSLGRKFVRMSLGGLHDEAEIRGHRKTYIGAMPGRIIQGLKKAKSSNPVFMLDEIDKISKDFHGDPASAMLEVLDPEQNSEFHDNYLEVDFNLSKVMFITTANTLNTIHPALLDRMELIDVSGYLQEEKVEIARRHLIPKQLKEHGVKPDQLKLKKEVVKMIVEHYTRESGVRQLDKKIAHLIRRVAKKIALEEDYNPEISREDIRQYLGIREYSKDAYEGNEYAGVVTGLAWTAVGGEILFVETSLSPGKGKFTLTGNLGEVMKESASIAFEYLQAHADSLDLSAEVFEKCNVHVHVPEGAIPKDGPSAGITMATSIASAFTQRKVKRHLAMTGEITLRGKVLPVGGIKEKILAAKRAGIKEIILSKENKRHLEDIKPAYIKGLKFNFVENISEVFDISLLKQKVSNPLQIK